jgi:hypothetical protein
MKKLEKEIIVCAFVAVLSGLSGLGFSRRYQIRHVRKEVLNIDNEPEKISQNIHNYCGSYDNWRRYNLHNV